MENLGNNSRAIFVAEGEDIVALRLKVKVNRERSVSKGVAVVSGS